MKYIAPSYELVGIETEDVITTSTSGTDNSTITNKINTLISPINFVNGQAYSLKLLLGMTSVKVEAEVDAWLTENETEVDLPENF